ncbi:jg668, partial [Pararge aegeria aegeria]
QEEALSHCQNAPSQGGPPPRHHSLLLCCFKDLCNHEDSPVARTRNLTANDL